MAGRPVLNDDARTLIEKAVRDQLAPADRERLEQLLLESDDVAEAYLDYFQLETDLHLLGYEERFLDHIDDVVAAATQCGLTVAQRRFGTRAVALVPRSFSHRLSRAFANTITPERHPFNYGLFCMACLLVCIFGFFVLITPNWWGDPEYIAEVLSDDDHDEYADGFRLSPYVARVTGRSADREWAPSQRSLGPHAHLRRGQVLRVASGLLQITHKDGGEVILEGPAQYRVTSRGAGELEEGRLTVRGIAGFQIFTDELVVTDLGTEFGVAVDADGTCDVQVFEGTVQANLTRSGRESLPIRLAANEAVRFDARTQQVQRRPPGNHFVRRLPARPVLEAPPVQAGPSQPVRVAGSAITVDATDQFILQAARGLQAVEDLSFDAAGADKLVVVLSTENASNHGNGEIVAVRYNGRPLALLVESKVDRGSAEIWYLDDPGSIGQGTIEVEAVNPNGGIGAAYALSNTQAGAGGATGTAAGDSVASVSLAASAADSLVIAVLNNSGQPNASGTPTAYVPLTQVSSGFWGGQWGGHASGYQPAAVAGRVTSWFTTNTGAGYSINLVAAEFLSQPGATIAVPAEEETPAAAEPADDAPAASKPIHANQAIHRRTGHPLRAGGGGLWPGPVRAARLDG